MKLDSSDLKPMADDLNKCIHKTKQICVYIQRYEIPYIF